LDANGNPHCVFTEQPCNDTRITMTPAYIRLREELDNFNPDMSGDSPYSIQVP